MVEQSTGRSRGSGAAASSWGGRRNANSSTSWGGGRLLRRAAQVAALAVGIAAVSTPVAALAAPGGAPSSHSVTAMDAKAGLAPRSTGGTDPRISRETAQEPGRQGVWSAWVDNSQFSPTNLQQQVNASWSDLGYGETVAVVDSGVDPVPALAGRVIDGADFTGTGFQDDYGHGTFVAGLIAGNGLNSKGQPTGITGVAPLAKILDVKVAGADGQSSVSQVTAALEWLLQHAAAYHVKVVNLSMSVSRPDSYNTAPVDALVEALWLSGITVVTSAGNDGGPVLRAPGNDPYVITVGSVAADGTLSPYSDHGLTQDGFAKPEVTAVGEHVQAPLPAGTTLAAEQTVSGLPAGYGQMSGTSMASAVAAGAATLLLQEHPTWTPGQVKGALEAGSGTDGQISVGASAALSHPADADAALAPSRALQLIYAQRVLGLNVTRSDVIWSDVIWSDVVWSDVTWSDVVWSDVIWSDVIWSDVIWSDVVWSDAT